MYSRMEGGRVIYSIDEGGIRYVKTTVIVDGEEYTFGDKGACTKGSRCK